VSARKSLISSMFALLFDLEDTGPYKAVRDAYVE
jgi:hypothetical protein